jgi:hypothetical protein
VCKLTVELDPKDRWRPGARPRERLSCLELHAVTCSARARSPAAPAYSTHQQALVLTQGQGHGRQGLTLLQPRQVKNIEVPLVEGLQAQGQRQAAVLGPATGSEQQQQQHWRTGHRAGRWVLPLGCCWAREEPIWGRSGMIRGKGRPRKHCTRKVTGLVLHGLLLCCCDSSPAPAALLSPPTDPFSHS